MRLRGTALCLLLAALTWQISPTQANTEASKKVVLGAPTPLWFFGNSLSSNAVLEEVFGIIPPCISSTWATYTDPPCIRAVQYRSSASDKWQDANFSQRDLTQYVERKPTEASFAAELSEARGRDDRLYFNGGSSSLWETPALMGGTSGSKNLFIVEATIASRVLPKTFSLSLVPVEITEELTNDLSDARRSFFRRLPFPVGYEFQVVIKQSQSMQPLQFVSSRTKNATLINTAGPKIASPEFIFSGEPSLHSLLESDLIRCSDPLLVKAIGEQCASIAGEKWKIYPWDRSVLSFLSNDAIEGFRESSLVSDWSFQGGQDTSLIFDFIQGCGYSNVFSLTSTNAPAYHINPPRWDRTESSLSVKIANTRLNSNAQIQRGFFSIQLRLSSAACMWKIDRNNVTANVEILSEDGIVQNVASSSIKIDEATDRISINLAGFTFSSPTIKIRLSEETPAAKPLVTAKKSKKTITCVKGKQRLKVPSSKGRCPVGYKRI